MDVGVIGVGTMGRNHVRVYSELKSVAHLGICDVNAQAAEAIGKQHGATVYPTVGELLAHVDAVSVCVPTQHHAAVVRQVFFAKKHAFIEKPICATAAEARELMAVRPAGITIGVGHIERFNPIIAEIKKIVTKPLYVELKRHNPASARVTGRLRGRGPDDPRHRHHRQRLFPGSLPHPFCRECRSLQRAHGVRRRARGTLGKP